MIANKYNVERDNYNIEYICVPKIEIYADSIR